MKKHIWPYFQSRWKKSQTVVANEFLCAKYLLHLSYVISHLLHASNAISHLSHPLHATNVILHSSHHIVTCPFSTHLSPPPSQGLRRPLRGHRSRALTAEPWPQNPLDGAVGYTGQRPSCWTSCRRRVLVR